MSQALASVNSTNQPTGAVIAAKNAANPPSPAKKTEDGFGFSDLLDVINPLQHIPIVGTIYRAITGDTIKPAARIAGDALFGGLIGLAGGIIDTVVEGETGKDIGQHVMATLGLDGDDDAAKTQVATTAAPAAPVQAQAQAAVAGPALATNPQTGAILAPNQPTDFFKSMQHPGKVSHGVPLSTTATLEARPGDRAAATQALLHAQQSLNPPTAPADKSAPQTSPATPAPNANPNAPLSILPPANSNTPSANNNQPMADNSGGNNGIVAAAAPDLVPQMMMQALDKYRVMQKVGPNAASAQTVNMVN